MQKCDLYYNSPLPSGEDKLYLAVMDLVQVGDTSTDAEPDVERDKNEDGSYTTYTRQKNAVSATIQLEGTCDSIAKASDALKSGEICIGGAMLNGVPLDNLHGIYCYVDGKATLTINSPKCIADIATLSIPVIVRGIVEPPAQYISTEGVPGVYFGNTSTLGAGDPEHLIKLADCRYIGGGEYIYDRPVDIAPQTEHVEWVAAFLCGEIETQGTPSPSFWLRKAGEEEYTRQAWKLSKELDPENYYEVPIGEYEAMLKIDTTGSNSPLKPFTLYFHGRGYTLNGT